MTYMDEARQGGHGELSASGGDEPSIAVIEQALVTMRRDQSRRRLHRRAEAEGSRRGRRDGGLGHAARFRMLDALEAASPGSASPSVSELADAIGVDQPRASRLVQSALDDGLVRRASDPRDARRSAVQLTAAGRRVLEEARSNRRRAVVEALAGFTPEETAQFAELLGRFVGHWPRD